LTNNKGYRRQILEGEYHEIRLSGNQYIRVDIFSVYSFSFVVFRSFAFAQDMLIGNKLV